MKTSFGQWLKNKLKEKRRSQVELASFIGVQPPQVSHIISGNRGTTPENLTAIAEFLKVGTEEVYRAAGWWPPALDVDGLTPAKREFLQLAEGASEAEVEMALAVLRAAWEQKKRK
jgi:transcriptional regulator with XRE-family HTH domain